VFPNKWVAALPRGMEGNFGDLQGYHKEIKDEKKICFK